VWYLGSMNDQLHAARALRTTIRATRQETEEARRLAPQVVASLLPDSAAWPCQPLWAGMRPSQG
jgi:hypothetical protein